MVEGEFEWDQTVRRGEEGEPRASEHVGYSVNGYGMGLLPRRENRHQLLQSDRISRFSRWNVGTVPLHGDHDSRIPISLQRSHRAPMPTTGALGGPRISLMSSNSYSRPNARKCAKSELKCGSERRWRI